MSSKSTQPKLVFANPSPEVAEEGVNLCKDQTKKSRRKSLLFVLVVAFMVLVLAIFVLAWYLTAQPEPPLQVGLSQTEVIEAMGSNPGWYPEMDSGVHDKIHPYQWKYDRRPDWRGNRGQVTVLFDDGVDWLRGTGMLDQGRLVTGWTVEDVPSPQPSWWPRTTKAIGW